MIPVDVVIPSWNGRHLLPYCLQALARQRGVRLSVVVVDNGSGDGSAAWLAREHGDVRCLALGRNEGFAAAMNRGLALGSGELVLALNNDAAPAPDYVRRLADALAARPRAGAVQGRILRHDDPTRVDSLGIRFDRELRAWQEGWGEPDPGPGPCRRIAGAGACAALYRRAALDDVADPGRPPAVFDPTFFAYYEDVDLALRLSAAGWEAWLDPAAACEHVGSATAGADSMGKAYRLGRNYLLYAARHLGPGGLAGLVPRLAATRLRRLATWPLHLRRDTALWAGEVAALPRLPAAFRKSRRRAATGPPG